MYTNHNQTNFDEVRYQTIGRGHGFSELDGVAFKIAEKYSFVISSPVDQLSMLQIRSESERISTEEQLYSFELEKKVLVNMDVSVNGS